MEQEGKDIDTVANIDWFHRESDGNVPRTPK
jgi:hypothetical protein